MLFINLHLRAFIAPDASQAIKFVNADLSMISARLYGQEFMGLPTFQVSPVLGQSSRVRGAHVFLRIKSQLTPPMAFISHTHTKNKYAH